MKILSYYQPASVVLRSHFHEYRSNVDTPFIWSHFIGAKQYNDLATLALPDAGLQVWSTQ